MNLSARVRSGWIRWVSVDLGAAVVALAELVTVLPALVLVRLGVGAAWAFLSALGAGALSFWLAKRAITLPVDLWRSA